MNENNKENQNAPIENKMGVVPINKLLITMSLPMVVAMLVQALYNIVDSIFVAQISENALSAVTLAFPAQMLIISVSTGTGVGINALLSKSLGEKNYNVVNKAATNGIFLALMSAIVFAVFGIFFSRVYFELQTDIPEIIEMGTTYLRICCICAFGPLLQITFERLLQSTGQTFYTMITQILGAVINIILDPILIFGWFGLPKMGVAGAAVATVTGEIIALALSVYLNHKKNHEIKLKIKGFRPDAKIIKRIYSVGIPSIIMSSIGSVMTFGMNIILMKFTPTAVAVFGVYYRLQSFIFMPVFGLNNGMVPIIAYNFGARKSERIKQTLKLSILYATTIMIIGLIIFWAFTPQLLAIFKASSTMLSIGIPALRIISLSFIFAGFSICTLSMLQALGHGFSSLIVSVIRQLVVLLPVAYILSILGDLSAVWWSFPIAEVVSLIFSALYLVKVYKKEIKPLEEI